MKSMRLMEGSSSKAEVGEKDESRILSIVFLSKWVVWHSYGPTPLHEKL